MEHPKQEGTHKDHTIQLLAPISLKFQTLFLRALSKCSLHSSRSGLCLIPFGSLFHAQHSLVKNLFLISKETEPAQKGGGWDKGLRKCRI